MKNNSVLNNLKIKYREINTNIKLIRIFKDANPISSHYSGRVDPETGRRRY